MRRGVKLGIGIPLTIVGALVLIAALALFTFVGFDGTFTTPPTTARTDTHAIVIAATLVDADLRSADLGEGAVSLDVEGQSGEVFVGVADADDVATYLDGVSVAEAVSLSYPGGVLAVRSTEGTRTPDRPSGEDFWAASRTGDGELSWDLTAGDWIVVIMNADASSGVDVEGTVTARVPALGAAVAVMLVIGLPLTVGGIVLIVSALRHRSTYEGRHLAARGAPPPVPGSPPAAPPRPDLPEA